MSDSPELLTPAEAATLLRTSTGVLAEWRSRGRPALPFCKVGKRILYQRQALLDYLSTRTYTSSTAARADDAA